MLSIRIGQSNDKRKRETHHIKREEALLGDSEKTWLFAVLGTGLRGGGMEPRPLQQG